MLEEWDAVLAAFVEINVTGVEMSKMPIFFVSSPCFITVAFIKQRKPLFNQLIIHRQYTNYYY